MIWPQTGGLSFLEIPFLAESAGVGGAKNNKTLPISPKTHFQVNHLRWFGGAQCSGVKMDWRKHWRFEFMAVDAGKMDLRNEIPTTEPLGEFDAHFSAISWQYFYTTSKFQCFFGSEFLFEKLSYDIANGFAGNFGSIWQINEKFWFDLAILHIGKMTELDEVSTQVPAEFQMGSLGRLKFNQWHIQCLGRLVANKNGLSQIRIGSEITGNIPLILRVGLVRQKENVQLYGGFGMNVGKYDFDFAMQNNPNLWGFPIWFSLSSEMGNN